MTTPFPTPAFPTPAPLLARWTAARLKLTLRTPRTVFFTFAFPLLMLVLFNGLEGNQQAAAVTTGTVRFAQFYTPSIAVFSLTSACYTALALGVANARDLGLLKRVRGTPLPMLTYLGAWLGAAVIVGVAAVIGLFAVAVPVFGVVLTPRLLPAAAVVLILGALALGSLGLAVAALARNVDQAAPIAQFTFLPLSFISGIWFPQREMPRWLTALADAFPLSHLVRAFSACFQSQTPGGGWQPRDLAVLAAWGAGGLLIASRRLRRDMQ